MNQFLLDTLAFTSIISGILVITASNPIVSVLFLITLFINVAGYLIVLGIGFIGITYLIVYVGAIAILFLFVIMMLNLQLAELTSVGSEYSQNLPLGATIGVLFIYEIFSLIPSSIKDIEQFNLTDSFNNWLIYLFNKMNTLFYLPSIDNDSMVANNIHLVFNPISAEAQLSSFLQVQSIGHILYLSGAIWLLIVSLILLLAMVGPIVLSMNRSN